MLLSNLYDRLIQLIAVHIPTCLRTEKSLTVLLLRLRRDIRVFKMRTRKGKSTNETNQRRHDWESKIMRKTLESRVKINSKV